MLWGNSEEPDSVREGEVLLELSLGKEVLVFRAERIVWTRPPRWCWGY